MQAVSYRPTRFPFIFHSTDGDERAEIGGTVLKFKAGAALKLGDYVYLSAAETVNKSTNTALHVSAIGVVVGGANTNNEVIADRASYGVITVADADEDVLVQIDGIAYVIPDATDAAGSLLIPDDAGTAGRVEAGTTATKIVGMLIDTPSAADSPTRALLFRA